MRPGIMPTTIMAIPGKAITAKAITAHSAMDKTKVSRAVAELERRGWLRRSTDPEDRRAENLALTANGLRAYRSIVPLAEDFERALCAQLGERPVARFLAGLDFTGHGFERSGTGHRPDPAPPVEDVRDRDSAKASRT